MALVPSGDAYGGQWGRTTFADALAARGDQPQRARRAPGTGDGVSGFIRATFQDGSEGRFRIDFIVSIRPHEGGSAIDMLGAPLGYWVKESPEDLYAQMDAAE